MKRKRASKTLLATIASMFLIAGAATGADTRTARESVSRVSPAPSARTETRRSMTFKSERTDSWLCNYVSPLFCTNLIPGLQSRPDGPTPSNSTPARGRK